MRVPVRLRGGMSVVVSCTHFASLCAIWTCAAKVCASDLCKELTPVAYAPGSPNNFSARNAPLLVGELVELVVERLQADAEFGVGGGLVAVVLLDDAEDVVHFHLAECPAGA